MEGYGTYPDSEVPEFNASIIELRKQCHELAKKILVLWAMSLNLEDFQYFLNHCTHIDNLALPRGGNMRAIRYPSIPKDMEIPIGTVRLGEHSDFCMLTFIFQDMIGGLEVISVHNAVVESYIALFYRYEILMENGFRLLQLQTQLS